MSTGQIVGTITGAAVGFAVGGPTGAVYGAQIGYAAGTALDPPKGPTVEGPRLSDLSVQTSTYGQFIPRTYGTIGLSGNVFWLENNKIKEVVKKKKSGGKGGGSSSTVKTYTYFATFAVGLCEGPIAGVRRIWVGPDLVYDAGSDDLETIISSNNASAKFTIYTGTDTQQPDPRMQAEMGVANCPAFRGLAYIVVKDLKLANYGNSVAGAQVKVEVVNSANVNNFRLVGQSSVANAFGPAAVFTSAFNYSELVITYSVPENDSRVVDGLVSIRKYNVITGQHSVAIPSVSVKGSTWGAGHGKSDSISFGVKDYSPGYVTPSIINEDASVVSFCDRFSIIGDNYYTAMQDGRLLCYSTLSSPITKTIEFTVPFTIQVGNSGLFWSVETDNIYVYFGVYSSAGVKTLLKFNRNEGHFVSSIVASGIDAISVVSDTEIFYCSGNAIKLTVDFFSTSSDLGSYPGAGTLGQSYGWSVFKIAQGVISISRSSPSGQEFKTFQYSLSLVSSQVPLSAIVATEAARSALIKPADIDATGLTDSVTGFKVTATGSIRNAIEPLRGAWPFDVVQSGYKIKARTRGSASVVTIPIGELAIDTQLTESREMDSQLPQNVTVKYIDRERDYDANEQRAQRDNTEAVNSLVLELPVVLSATQSAQVADKLIRIYALEKSDFSFTLPAPYRYLEPGDVVTIATDDADYVLRLVSVNQTADGRLECAGRPSSAATYTSIAPGDGGQQGTVTIPLAGATVGLLIDCPVIDEGLQDDPGFAVGMNGYSAGWPGGILYRTADNGQTWDDLQALTGRATAGFASGVLAASEGNLIQRGGSLTVSLIGGTLESVTEAQMLNGANIAAYGVNGRWEILRFQNATLNADGTYTLDTFWRGDKGTEWATVLHAANDYFVLMTDPDLAFIGMPTDSIGQPRDYRSVTAGADIDSATSASFTYDAVNLEALSGVHPKGVRSAGDLTVTWQRRTRVGGAWRDYVDASLGEELQAYEVDIMQGAVVKRTLTASTPSVLYTSAMQVTDFGSAQASVTVNIYQLSAVVGRGYKLEATL